jgi:small subunit ribosomal protein S4
VPEWLSLDEENYTGTVMRLPERDDITFPIDEQMIVEFYSRV